MKHTLRIAPMVGVIVCCSLTANAQAKPNETGDDVIPSKTAALLREFKTAKYFWQQGEIGDKIVALRDKSVAPAMLELLKSEKRSERCNAGRVLAGLGDDRGLFAVIAELTDITDRPLVETHRGTRESQFGQDHYYAAFVLGEIGDRRAAPALIGMLNDDSINYEAAIVLGHLGDAHAITALRPFVLRADPSSASVSTDMKLWAGYGLMWLGDPLGLSTVASFLEPKHDWVQRRAAAEAFGEWGDTRAVPFLLAALDDKEVNVRVSAIKALGSIGDSSALPALQGLLKDTTATTSWAPITVRQAATDAIGRIHDKTAGIGSR